MSILRELFGPSKGEIWSQLSQEIGASYDEGGFFKQGAVRLAYRQWEITLDTYTVSDGKTSSTYTRIRAPFVNPDGFRLKIYREGVFTGIGKVLGLQDIEIGDAFFDQQFVIQGGPEDMVKRLLENGRIRELIHAQPNIHFSIKDDEGWFGAKFPEGVDELYFSTYGVVKDVERLKALFELFATVLDELCRMNPAYTVEPQVKLS
ncbi:MAG: DUF3137 domain-containing protein [Anaerolineae bacterium]